jgi:hypothetical protein
MKFFPVAAYGRLDLLWTANLNRAFWLNRNWELAQDQDRCRNFCACLVFGLLGRKNLKSMADTGEL